MMRALLTLLCAAGVALLLAACGPGPTQRPAAFSPIQVPEATAGAVAPAPSPPAGQPFPPARPSAARGQAIYAGQCAGCHTAGGGAAAPAGVDLADPALISALSPAGFYEAVREGVPGKMPAFGQELDEMQMWDTVAYARSLSEVPEMLALGEQTYREQCAPCHGAGGDGSGQAGAARFTDQAFMAAQTHGTLAGAITQGVPGTRMPAFGESLSQDQIWTVVSYLWTFAWDGTDR
jgi:cbb3-type cytochrome c oxidase subunit III